MCIKMYRTDIYCSFIEGLKKWGKRHPNTQWLDILEIKYEQLLYIH